MTTAIESNSTRRLRLDLFFESETNRDFAQRAATDLRATVARLAPHIDLQVDIHLATNIVPWVFPWRDQTIRTVRHEPTSPERQSLVVVGRDIGAQGWGGPGYAVVSKPRMDQKVANGGDPTDILVHEWLHTIQGVVINGRPVPFADDAQEFGFQGLPGPDGEDRWDPWISYVLGVGPDL